VSLVSETRSWRLDVPQAGWSYSHRLRLDRRRSILGKRTGPRGGLESTGYSNQRSGVRTVASHSLLNQKAATDYADPWKA